MMLPFALLPILQFTSDKRIMGWCKSPKSILAVVWFLAFLVFGINVYLVVTSIMGYDLKPGYIALISIIYIIYSIFVFYFLLAALKIKIPFIEHLFPPPVNTQGGSVKEDKDFTEDDNLVSNEIRHSGNDDDS